MNVISKRMALVIDLLVLLLLWFMASLLLDKPFLPDPLIVAQTFWAEFSAGWQPFLTAWQREGWAAGIEASRTSLFGHSWKSSQRVLFSIGLGTLSAAPLAILAAQSKILNKFLSPLIYALYPVPKIVFLPIIIFMLGLGDPSINFLITLVVFFQIFVIVGDAAAQVPAETIDSIRSLGASRWDIIRHVYWPVSLPATITAVKISIGTAIAVLFIAESIGNNVGLGYYIVVEQWNRFAYDKVYAGIVAISLLGSILFGLLSGVERWLTRWRRTNY